MSLGSGEFCSWGEVEQNDVSSEAESFARGVRLSDVSLGSKEFYSDIGSKRSLVSISFIPNPPHVKSPTLIHLTLNPSPEGEGLLHRHGDGRVNDVVLTK